MVRGTRSRCRSNVWRLHQALDQSSPDQIAHYIKGVGTSGFRPFALIDGATGIGVRSNVRKLYEFICWNWQQGDEIYMFGFSRGAFTIRTLIGLIHYEGLSPTAINGEPVSKAEMRRNVVAAWRSYREKTIRWIKVSHHRTCADDPRCFHNDVSRPAGSP